MMSEQIKRMLVMLQGLILVAAIALGWGAGWAGEARYPVQIIPPGGAAVTYYLELAATPEDRQDGLMYRTDLPQTGGMLFAWPEERPRSFWMKNTPLSLDILFFSEDRILVSAHLATRPYSEARLRSGTPAQYVVELRAGQAEAKGLDIGSVLRLPDALEHRLSW